MRLNAYFFAIILLWLSFDARAANSNKNNDFAKIFLIISSPKVLSESGQNLIKKFDGICLKQMPSGPDKYKQGNVQCRSNSGFEKLTISNLAGENVETITAEISGAERCSYIRQVLTKNFGKASKIQSDCQMDWKFKTRGQQSRVLVRLELDKQQNLIYFSIANEDEP